MAALIYHLLSLSLFISLGSVCASTPANFSGSAAAEDFYSDDDGRSDLRSLPQLNSSKCAMKTNFQISQVSCPGKQEHFEMAKRFVKLNNTDDAINIRFLMPGLDKEDIIVYVDETDQLIVEGKKGMDFEHGFFRPRFVLHLPMTFLKANEITAEMKDGVLKLRVPKTKLQQQRSSKVVSVNVY